MSGTSRVIWTGGYWRPKWSSEEVTIARFGVTGPIEVICKDVQSMSPALTAIGWRMTVPLTRFKSQTPTRSGAGRQIFIPFFFFLDAAIKYYLPVNW